MIAHGQNRARQSSGARLVVFLCFSVVGEYTKFGTSVAVCQQLETFTHNFFRDIQQKSLNRPPNELVAKARGVPF
jgi:hypothetical protein